MKLLGNLPENVLADISGLYADIDERELRIQKLTTEKVDADKVAARAAEVEKERDGLKTQKLELENQLAKYTGKPADEIELSAFRPLFDLFS